MGNSIASSIADKQKEVQKEMQKEMQAVQMRNQIRMQERMRRQMMATQIAITKERLWWFYGVDSLLTLGVIGRYIKTKSVPAPVLVPVFALYTVTAYQWDLAYGTKAARINRYMEESLADSRNWFSPLMPEDETESHPPNTPSTNKGSSAATSSSSSSSSSAVNTKEQQGVKK